jgi:uncharacterized membrane protein
MAHRRNKQKHDLSRQIPSQGSDPTNDPTPPTSKQQPFNRVAHTVSVRGEHFSGPLPPPQVLLKYNEAVPGGAERIFAMAERQSHHRQDLEKTVIGRRTQYEGRAQILGFILAMTVAVGSMILVGMGKSIEGLVALGADLIAMAGVFIYGRKRQEGELAEKREALVPSQPPS